MINGERKGENSNYPNAGINHPDPFDNCSPWLDRKSDPEDLSNPSDYSSCEESEFERYCSANSVIGTASLCSSIGTSNEFLGPDFTSVRNTGFGWRSFGSGGTVVTSEILDSFGDGSIECHKENEAFENPFLSGEAMSLEVGNGSNSLLGSDVNSSSFRSNNYDENVDGSLMQLGVGSRSALLWSTYEDFEDDRAISEENDSKKRIPARAGNGSDVSSSSSRTSNANPNLGGNGSLSLSTSAENYSSHETSGVANDNADLRSLSDVKRLDLIAGCDKNSLLGVDICKDKNIDNLVERDHNNLVHCQQLRTEHGLQIDDREIRVGEETSSRCEHSDGDDSMLDYGTDDEDMPCTYEQRNLQYLKETKLKNENPLLMNSVVAFGSDDWDEFEQEVKVSTLEPVSLEKPPKQQVHLQIEEPDVRTLNSSNVSCIGAPFLEAIELEEHMKDIPVSTCQVQEMNGFVQDIKSCSVGNLLVGEKESSKQMSHLEVYHIDDNTDTAESHHKIKENAGERELQCICSEKVVDLHEDGVLKRELFDTSNLPADPLYGIKTVQPHSPVSETFQGKELKFGEDHKLSKPLTLAGDIRHISQKQTTVDSAASTNLGEECLAPDEVEKLEPDEFYDDMVQEMEEILLDSGKPFGAQFSYGSQKSVSHLCQTLRDGGSTASTSGTDDAYSPIVYPLKIDWVEVIGAKQKKGDVSFGERLVGVKEYTVYVIRVWNGKDQWEVERRYRDFFTLYRQLKNFFTDHGGILPSPWSSVDRESRKIFGNASPNVITERSILIQDCIRSILKESPFGTPSSLIWFLSPQKTSSNSSTLNAVGPQYVERLPENGNSILSFQREGFLEGTSTLGKTISLLLEVKPRKSIEQLLEAQHYTCAGCHKRLEAGKSRMQELVQTFGWGKPRLCEYTGQLFCASCHTNDTAVLPARVLHHWDFSLYPVSQLAKAYLESIYDQPMLCVSAVNPFLFSKVPALLHVMGIRKKIGTMLPYLHCPFRRSIQRGLGSRRYLLENNEFFSLRDLVDLSKGAFAALPALVETVSTKILVHITQQCLVCCDVGIPCGARQACEDPSSLIFPFQEAEITRCSSCNNVFHKPCFRKLENCPCGTGAKVGEKLVSTEQQMNRHSSESEGVLDTLARKPKSKSAVGFFSDLWRSNNDNPVILMGSFPSTAL